MSEGKKKSAAASAQQGSGGDKPTKKKGRPPPLETQAEPMPMFGQGPASVMHPSNFALPTMRNMFMPPNQQIVITPAAQMWDAGEQAQLDRLHRVMCFQNESLSNKSIKIAAHLNAKTVRDVACRIKLMEESDTAQARAADDVDRQLVRGEAIISELQSIPSRDRTDQQNARLAALMKEFVSLTKDSRAKLDAKQLKIPVQFITLPELPDALRSSDGAKPSSSSSGGK